ncbi:MAG: hypothetical protein Q8L45_13830 [Xanthomonadaceae bacterium]|nr:hypothetical protein [Xanthomonadaceae bacterium]MDP2184992.1 hypothetical protein [Xanthomonadales bacterium]MDZ4114490.1 hypothetical protein [Xanthomonadaceae bacterium]MDZ4377857.1 hypothetical protein [Xanthomonadaceae bacterium]
MPGIPSVRRKSDAVAFVGSDGAQRRATLPAIAIPPVAVNVAANPCIGVLVVAADESVAGALHDALSTADGFAAQLTHVASLAEALEVPATALPVAGLRNDPVGDARWRCTATPGFGLWPQPGLPDLVFL